MPSRRSLPQRWPVRRNVPAELPGHLRSLYPRADNPDPDIGGADQDTELHADLRADCAAVACAHRVTDKAGNTLANDDADCGASGAVVLQQRCRSLSGFSGSVLQQNWQPHNRVGPGLQTVLPRL